MKFHRKVGGIHWFALGPYRLSFCKVTRPKRYRLPRANIFQLEDAIRQEVEAIQADRRLVTYAEQEHNRFIF